MPLFNFYFEKEQYAEQECQEEDIVKFMRLVISKMTLASECIVISLIYLEKLMHTSKIEIRYINWEPLLFTAILLASKFWEDVNYWNIDYEEHLGLYPLKSINRMESEFLSLCDYNMYVSAELYANYQEKVRMITNQNVRQSQLFQASGLAKRNEYTENKANPSPGLFDNKLLTSEGEFKISHEAQASLLPDDYEQLKTSTNFHMEGLDQGLRRKTSYDEAEDNEAD